MCILNTQKKTEAATCDSRSPPVVLFVTGWNRKGKGRRKVEILRTRGIVGSAVVGLPFFIRVCITNEQSPLDNGDHNLSWEKIKLLSKPVNFLSLLSSQSYS